MLNFVVTDVYALFNIHVKRSTTWLCKNEGGGGQGPFTQCVKKHPIWYKTASLSRALKKERTLFLYSAAFVSFASLVWNQAVEQTQTLMFMIFVHVDYWAYLSNQTSWWSSVHCARQNFELVQYGSNSDLQIKTFAIEFSNKKEVSCFVTTKLILK